MALHFRNIYSNKTRTMHIDEDEIDGENKLDDIYSGRFSGYSMHNFNPTLDKLIKGRLNVDDVIKRHRRVRRNVMKKDTIEHVTKIMESIEEELDDLKVTANSRVCAR